MGRLRWFGESTAAQSRHCEYFMKLVLSMSVSKEKVVAGVPTITVEWNNVRSALHAALEDRFDVEGGRWAVHTLWEFWRSTGRTAEGW